MKSFSKKGVMLFAGAMALCAFVLPSVASAASWGVTGSAHTLDSPNIGFTSATAGGLTSSCTGTQAASTVSSAGTLSITSGWSTSCTATAPAVGAHCVLSSGATGFPWQATATTTSNIQVHNVRVDVRFTDQPGRAGSCGPLNGVTVLLTGTVTSGQWNGNGAGQHAVVFSNAAGLVSHSGGVATAVAIRGTFSDTQQTLTVS